MTSENSQTPLSSAEFHLSGICLQRVPLEFVCKGFHLSLTTEDSTEVYPQLGSNGVCLERVPWEFDFRGFHQSWSSDSSTGFCVRKFYWNLFSEDSTRVYPKRAPLEFVLKGFLQSLTLQDSNGVWLQRVPLEFVRGGSTGVCFYQGSTIPTLQQWDTSQQFQTDTWGCRSSLHCTQNNGKRMPMGNTWH